MSVRAVLLDLFDTLVDLRVETLPPVRVGERTVGSTYLDLHRVIVRDLEVDFETFANQLWEIDLEEGGSRWRRHEEFPTLERFRILVERLGGGPATLVDELTATHMGRLRELAVAPAHHAAVLQRLRTRSRIAVCSNFSHRPTALQILEDGGLLPSLDAVVISDEIGYRKPRREIFEATLARLGVEAAEAVHVGDGLDVDVAGAQALGLRTAWCVRRVQDPDATLARYAGAPPDWTLRDLSELPDLLR